MENIVVGKLIKQFVEVVLDQDDDTVEYRHLVEVYDRLDGISSPLEKGGDSSTGTPLSICCAQECHEGTGTPLSTCSIVSGERHRRREQME